MNEATHRQSLQAAVRHARGGEFAPAEQLLRQVLADQPENPHALQLLGALLAQTGHPAESVEFLRRAIAIDPNNPATHSNLGDALRLNGRIPEAIAACRRSLQIRPDFPESMNNLALALFEDGQLDESISLFESAIKLRPNLPEASVNLAMALRHRGQIDAAIDACRRAIALRPDFALAHLNLAELLLLKGDFQEGILEHEWRFKVTRPDTPQRARFLRTIWDGMPLRGQKIVLGCEGGFGDVLQFVRYLPQVVEKGGRVILQCQPELFRLFQNLRGYEQLIRSDETVPDCDVHCPSMSLMRAFGTTLQTIPPHSPPIAAPAELIETWRKRLEPGRGPLKIGLVWGGRPNRERGRSLSLSAMAPLAGIVGAEYYSLQTGEDSRQIGQWPAGSKLTDFGGDLRDFADTAALIANLDLVITIDTAAAHLAGAMGKPVWVLLPFAPSWRWLLDRRDSPWYPTMRLFRQSRHGVWTDPVRQVAAELAKHPNLA